MNKNPIKSKYKAVIFDFDDTLVESRVAKWAHHTHVAKKFYNLDLTEEDIRKQWGKPFDTLITELYENSDTLENIHSAIYSVRDQFPKFPYKESIAILHILISNRIKIGVLSATTTKFLTEDLTHLEFPVSDFILIQGADQTSFHKPDPKVFLPLIASLEKEGLKKEEIAYVGDSLDDFKASTGAGLHFIALTTGLYSRKDFIDAGARIVFDTIKDILTDIFPK